ncbi:hypothetical protein MEBOL_000706 [Melittangium boletus DSM 14713]|uniref:Uncharacterized protein n=2 Tax=Melittangium boletus TaxID=83453 RepID=A0A250I7U4_9BACT|nr:hypothetical protein MEBOL_000706 [Melittangium boletus DSM 14713]
MAGLWLVTATAASAQLEVGGRPDIIRVDPREEAFSLSWSDTEERLQGTLRPAPIRKGQPFQVSLDVGSFEGAPFEGPIVLTLRPAGASLGQSVTVKPQGRHWEATFTPEEEGPHLLDVSFRTTRNKALHGAFEVGASVLPRQLAWGLLAVGTLALLGYSVFSLLRAPRPDPQETPPQTPEPTPPSAEVPPAAPESPEPVAPTPPPEPEPPRDP